MMSFSRYATKQSVIRNFFVAFATLSTTLFTGCATQDMANFAMALQALSEGYIQGYQATAPIYQAQPQYYYPAIQQPQQTNTYCRISGDNAFCNTRPTGFSWNYNPTIQQPQQSNTYCQMMGSHVICY